LPKRPARPAAILDVADLKLAHNTSAAIPDKRREAISEEMSAKATKQIQEAETSAPETPEVAKPSKSSTLDLSGLSTASNSVTQSEPPARQKRTKSPNANKSSNKSPGADCANFLCWTPMISCTIQARSSDSKSMMSFCP